MTKRYYYKDPLAAMWMLKHFGMQSGIQSYVLAQESGGVEMADFKIYIHPDSEHILEEMPFEKKAALMALDMWPESEEV